MRRMLLVGLVVLAGCDSSDASKEPNGCFTISPATEQQPFSPILVDACTGMTWLLVRSDLGEKPEDGFSYRWHIIDKLDFSPAVLTKKER